MVNLDLEVGVAAFEFGDDRLVRLLLGRNSDPVGVMNDRATLDALASFDKHRADQQQAGDREEQDGSHARTPFLPGSPIYAARRPAMSDER